VADYIQDKYGIPMVLSHTDRPKRTKNEKGHTFHTKESFDELDSENFVAYTEWQGNRYCCLHSDVKQHNTYVIDESGYSMLKTKYRDRYNVRGLRIYRDEGARRMSVGDERVDRDEGKFRLYSGDWDFEIHNVSFLSKVNRETSKIVEHFFQLGGEPCI
jgi:guanylate kinase